MKTKTLKRLLRMDGPLLSIVSLVIAIVISAIIMAVCGYNPFEAYGAIVKGSFGSQRAIVQTLTQATPLIFTGLAFTLAKKANLINLGAEGQLYLGALAAAVVGMTDLGLPTVLHLPLAVLAGMAAGGIYAGLVGFLKVRFGSNEVIATIMLNSIAIYFVDYLLNGPLLAEGSSVAQTERVLQTAQLPRIFQQYQLTIAIIIAVAACILVKLFMDKTNLGYEIRSVGLNPEAAETAGISKAKVTVHQRLHRWSGRRQPCAGRGPPPHQRLLPRLRLLRHLGGRPGRRQPGGRHLRRHRVRRSAGRYHGAQPHHQHPGGVRQRNPGHGGYPGGRSAAGQGTQASQPCGTLPQDRKGGRLIWALSSTTWSPLSPPPSPCPSP